MAYFPMFVDLAGKHVLVVGGGVIAARRIRTLLEFGCEITVVSLEVCGDLRELCEEEKGNGDVSEACVRWKKKMYDVGDLEIEETPESAADVGDLEKGGRFGSVADVGDHSGKNHGFFFVLAAATAPVNNLVVCDCREKKIPVNNASDRDQCDFYFPGIAKKGEAVIGITSGGSDHKKAAKLTGEIRKVLDRE